LPQLLEMARIPTSPCSGSNYCVNVTGCTCELRSGQQTGESFLERSKDDRDRLPGVITTLLFRSVPRRFTEAAVLLQLEAFLVDRCDYDLIYMPWDARKATNIGFVFINFVSEVVAARVYKKMDGAHWRTEQTDKQINIMPAHCQGLAANIAHYASTRAVAEDHQHPPMVFVNGFHIPFPEAVMLFFRSGLHQSPTCVTAAHVQVDNFCSWELMCSHSSSRYEMLSMGNGTSHVERLDLRSSPVYHKSWRHINMLLRMLLECESLQHTKNTSVHC